MIGSVIVILAQSMFVWSMLKLGSNYSPCYNSHIPRGITTSGPYRYVRHPIYTSNMAVLMGITLMSGTLLLLVNVVILAIGYYRAAHQEEASLRAEHPEYQRYQKHTGMLIPRLFARSED